MFPDTGNGKGSEASTSTGMSQRCCQFEFDEILLATDNFNESLVVGKGGFGKVYKGNIKIGTTHVDVAIKRLDLMSNQGSTEFWAEVEMLSKLRHAHLVSLIGYCNYEKEMILVYEYMPHGTLEDHLHKLHTPLSWLERLKICIGAARGLDYLHTGTGTEVCVIHRDVKSSNILLHESWEAKISDFGLARIGPKNQPSTNVYTHVKGTFGYIDPNYFATGKLTRKSDVYAFGVVLFEVLCQKRPLDKSFERGLATWIQESIKEGKLKHIVYSGIRSEISSKCLKGFARIAGRCLNDHPNHRPTMTEVVFSLESLLAQSGENSGVSLSMGVSFLMGISYALYAKEKRQRNRFFKRNGGILLKQAAEVDQSLVDKIILFTPHELAKATDNFNETRVLGRGCQGTVYKGMLVDGRIVAIKKSNVVDESQLEQFINEMVILSQINHRNVVKLLGCCLETEVPLLVYEFISNGTLYDRLHNDTDEFPFSLNMRLQIATEVAGALAYLHSAALIPIYHRDIKTTNILLDDKYTAKVSDFGTSRLVPLDQSHLTTMVKGTFGYLDPEYFQSSQFTEKSDVYSFGVVLVELITGEKPISLTRFGEHRSLATHFKIAMEEGRVVSTFDEKMIKEAIGDELLLIANLAMRCLNLIGKNRPTMKEVVGELETIRTSHIPSTDQTNMNPMIYRVELSKQPYGESTSTFSLDDNISHIGR